MSNRQAFEFDETKDPVTLTVVTKSATKWLLIDRETGQIYQGNPEGYWDKLKTVERINE